MAFRGRGGRGRGGGRGHYERSGVKKPYILFPEDVSVPVLPNVDTLSKEDKGLIILKYKLESFWSGSCYHLEQEPVKSRKRSKTDEVKETEDVEIQRYTDRFKKKKKEKREELGSYLRLTPSNFPSELIQGNRRAQISNKKLRWDPTSALNLDEWEKKEEKAKGQEGKDPKKDDEDEEDLEEEAEEVESDDDYMMNQHFDDDEDDWNVEEQPDEDYYE